MKTQFKLACVAFAIAALAGCDTAPRSQEPCVDGGSNCVPASQIEQQKKAEQAAIQAQAQAQTEAESRARFDAYQNAMNEEVRDAEMSIAAALEATKTLPKAHRARNTSVMTKSVQVTDSQTSRVAEVTVLESVEIQLPVAGKGKRGYVNAMNEVKALASRIADRRDGATILVEQASADMRGRKVNTAEGESQTKNGKSLTVRKAASATVPRGVERYTIQPGELTQRP